MQQLSMQQVHAMGCSTRLTRLPHRAVVVHWDDTSPGEELCMHQMTQTCLIRARRVACDAPTGRRFSSTQACSVTACSPLGAYQSL